MYVMKRDGAKVPFDKTKIYDAINKAFLEVDGQLYETDTAADIAEEIAIEAERHIKPLSVEKIQESGCCRTKPWSIRWLVAYES